MWKKKRLSAETFQRRTHQQTGQYGKTYKNTKEKEHV